MQRGLLGPEQTTLTSADDTTVAKASGEGQPPEISKHSTTTESDIAVSYGKAGWTRAKSAPMLPGIAKHSATTKPELAESSGGAGPSWSRADGMNSVAATAAVEAFGEARPPRFVKYSVTSESEPELAESSDEAETGCARPSRKETVEAVTMVPRERVHQWCGATSGCTSNSGMAGERNHSAWKEGGVLSFTVKAGRAGDSFEHFCAFDGMRAFLHFVCVPFLFLCVIQVERRPRHSRKDGFPYFRCVRVGRES